MTALAIGLNARKMLRFALAQVVLTLAWASGRVLNSNPAVSMETANCQESYSIV